MEMRRNASKRPMRTAHPKPGNGRPVLRIQRVSTAQAIVNELTRQILNGDTEAGTFMREIELAKAFGVSRQSLRAALAELVHSGLLRREANRGVWVPEQSLDDIEDLYYVRGVIEGAAVRHLVISPPSDWGPVDAAVEQLNRLPADALWSEVVEADFAFHRALVAIVGSPRLSRSHELLCSETRLSLVPVQRLDKYRSGAFAHQEHDKLLRSVKLRNMELAEARITKHLQEGSANALRMLHEKAQVAAADRGRAR